MKKLSYILLLLLAGGLLCPAPARAQMSGSDSLQAKLSSIFAPLDKSQIPTGYLYEAGVRVLDMRHYNGVLSDSNRTDMDVLRYLRLISRSARLHGTDTLPTLAAYNARLLAASAASGEAIPISVQHLNYARIRPDALQNNLLRVHNEQVYDVAGRLQSPYQTAVLFAAAPTRTRVRTSTVAFVFRRNLYLQANAGLPSAIYLDFGNGQGYRAAAWDQPLSATYPTAGTKRVRVKVVFDPYAMPLNAKSAKSGPTANKAAPQPTITAYESWFDIEVPSVVANRGITGTPNCAICDAEQPFPAGNTVGGPHSGGTAFVIYGNNANGTKHTQLTKPFIISEGYNLYDIAPELRKCNNPNNDIEEFFNNIDRNFRNSQGIITGNFRTNLLNAGYDIVYIDNARGTDDIVRNAQLFEAAVRWVNQSKVSGLSGQQNVVMGQSMGGLVSRYGLADMVKRGNDNPHTRLLVLHDSPQRGANNPVGLQSLTRSFDVPFLFGNTVADLNGELTAVRRVLNQPATQQLSILNAFNGRNDIRLNTFIPDIYEPKITFAGGAAPYEVIAVSNGSQCGVPQPTPVGVTISQSTLALLIPVPYAGPAGVTGEFGAYGLPAYGQRATISRADIRLEYRIRIGGRCPLCLTIPIRFRLLRESQLSPPNTLPLETLPGGNTNPYEQGNDCAQAGAVDLGSLNGVYAAYFRTSLYNGNICFVPTYSAMDVRTVTPATAYAKYINQTTTAAAPPQVAHFVAQEEDNSSWVGTHFNVPHIRFTPRNSEWIFNEMQRYLHTNPHTSANLLACGPAECNPYADYAIAGRQTLCPNATETYTLAGAPADALMEWMVSGPSGVVTPLYHGNSWPTVQVATGGTTGNFTIAAELHTPCGDVYFSRTIEVRNSSVSVTASTTLTCPNQPVLFRANLVNTVGPVS